MAKREIIPTHPGSVLKDELDKLQIKAAEFAVELNIHPNRLYSLLQGRKAMKARMAVAISKLLGPTPEFWLSLQMRYDLDVVRANNKLNRDGK